MKVLMLGWEFPPHNSGGLGVACLGLAEALVENHIDVTFILPRLLNVTHDKIKLQFAGVDRFNLKPLNVALSPYMTGNTYNILKRHLWGNLYGSTLFEEIYRYAELVGDIAKEDVYDIIHAHDWLAYLAGIEAKRVTGKPLILHVHATSFDQSGGRNVNQEQYAIERFAMSKADAIIAISEYTKEMLIREFGVSGEKIQVVHNGVYHVTDTQENAQVAQVLTLKKSGYKVVLFLGRLTIQKGPDYLLRAAKEVLAYEPNTLFLFAGSGDMEGQLIREAGALGISDKCIFVGFVRGEERRSLYMSADLFVMPSVSEPFGLAPLEALVEGGAPVLISKQSGVSEVLKHALKVDFWDIDEMTNKIIAVLRHEPLAWELQKQGKIEALQMTWDKAALRCIALYRRLIGTFSHMYT